VPEVNRRGFLVTFGGDTFCFTGAAVQTSGVVDPIKL
jgi:hypothetical protein